MARSFAVGFAALLFLLAGTWPAKAASVTVAVASNFHATAKKLVLKFEETTGHEVTLVAGSTGKLYAQIQHGAPFDVFLAADRARPEKLETTQRAVGGSGFTYARGKLVLWSARNDYFETDPVAQLKAGRFKRLAMANPKTAPYGKAAQAVLKKLGLWSTLSTRRVQGENIGQTFQFVISGNAELGFIAGSQLLDPKLKHKGSAWNIPAEWYPSIDQGAVLLSRARNNPAARAFLEFLKGPAATRIIQAYGYSTS